MFAIGLMSGTSLDGVDCSLIETDGKKLIQSISNFYLPYPLKFQIKLSKLLNDYSDFLYIEKELTYYHALCVNEILIKTGFSRNNINIIGFPGQTIVHNPEAGVSWQIGNPHQLCASTGIKVINDFRRRDISRGGLGAPLMPIFHQSLVKSVPHPVIILNIGGVSNITYIDSSELVAFDVGPGNALINDAVMNYYKKTYDHEGNIARSGVINEQLTDIILRDKFFKTSPPKSLDRNTFSQYNALFDNLQSADVVATLTYLTIKSIALSLKLLPSLPNIIYICGGGAKNIYMIELLKDELNKQSNELKVMNIEHLGVDADFVESQGFAFLAVRYLKGLKSSFINTTLVKSPTIAGVLVEG